MSRRIPLLLVALTALGALGFLARGLFESAPTPAGLEGGARTNGVDPPPRQGSEEARAQPVEGSDSTSNDDAEAPPTTNTRESLGESRLADAHWVEGRLLLPPGVPFDEAAEIEAAGRRFESGPFHRVQVTSNGAFRVAFAPKTRRGRFLLHGRYLYLDAPERIDLQNPENPLEIRAHLGGRIEGRLVAPMEAPASIELAGRTVELEGTRTSGSRDSRRSWDRSVETDASGAFTFDALPSDGTYTLLCNPPGAAPVKLEGVRVDPGSVRTVELPLQRGVSLAGRVLDTEGHGVPSASIRVERIQRFGWSEPETTSTDVEGSFRISGLPPGRLRVEAEAPGLLPAHLEFEDLPDGSHREGIELVLGTGLGVTGRVLWPDGSPAPAASLVLECRGPDEHSHEEQWSRTLDAADSEGRFWVTGLPEGHFRVRARAVPDAERLDRLRGLGHASGALEGDAFEARTVLASAPLGEIELRLAAGHAFTGRVEDGRGEAIERARVKLVRLGPNQEPSGEAEDSPEGDDPWWSEDAEMLDEVEGDTSVDGDGSFRIGGLRAGRWAVTVDAPGCTSLGPVALGIPHPEPWVAILPRTAGVRGRVLDGSGQGIEGAGVRAISANPNADWDEGAASGTQRTDREGRFELEGIESGVVRITAWAQGHAPANSLALDLRPGEQRDDLEIRLGPAGRIEGRVLDPKGAVASGWRITLRSFLSNRPLGTKSDGDGGFRFDDLAAGVYFLEAAPPSSVLDEVFGGRDSWEREEYYALTAQARIELGPGERRTVELGGAPGDPVRLHGTATRNGVAVAGVELRLGLVGDARGSIAFGKTNAEGEYAVDLVRPGAWKGHVQVDGIAWETFLEIPKVDSFRHDVVLPTGSVEGRVVDAEGKGIARMGVQVVRTDGEVGGPGGGWTEADEEGRFEVRSLPAGTFELRAGGAFPWEPELSRFQPVTQSFTLEEGETLGGLEILLEEGGVLHVDVLDTSGRPLSEATVLVYDDQGRIVQWSSPFGQQVHDARRTLRGLPFGPLSLTASSEFEVTAKPVSVFLTDTEPASLELRLERGTMLVLDLHGFDPERPPMVGEAVHADGRRFQPTIQAVGWDPDIALAAPIQRIGPVPAGSYTVRASNAAGERSEERTIEVAGETEIRVPLGPR